jgi:hypothetical protein
VMADFFAEPDRLGLGLGDEHAPAADTPTPERH